MGMTGHDPSTLSSQRQAAICRCLCDSADNGPASGTPRFDCAICSCCTLHAEGVRRVQQQTQDKQQQAAVSLKQHIDEAQAALALKAEVHQTRAKQQAEMHAQAFSSLLEAGQNPYAVRPSSSFYDQLVSSQHTSVYSVGVNSTCKGQMCTRPEPSTGRNACSLLSRNLMQQLHCVPTWADCQC